jgi:hypothetical protein
VPESEGKALGRDDGNGDEIALDVDGADVPPTTEGKVLGKDVGAVTDADGDDVPPTTDGKALGRDDGDGDEIDLDVDGADVPPATEGKALGRDDGDGDEIDLDVDGADVPPATEGKALGKDVVSLVGWFVGFVFGAVGWMLDSDEGSWVGAEFSDVGCRVGGIDESDGDV